MPLKNALIFEPDEDAKKGKIGLMRDLTVTLNTIKNLFLV